MNGKILVIGATGRTGSELTKLLLGNGTPVRAATRNPSSGPSKSLGNIEAVAFDFDRPETFPPALRGVEKVFLMARPADSHSDKAAIPFVDEAKKANVRHIVNLTSMGAEKDETFALRILEKYIENSGMPYTHLRPNWFMQNFTSGPMYSDIMATGALYLPAGDAKVSFIDVRDLAEVAYAALTGTLHLGKAYTLTGSEALSHYQVLEMISKVARRPLKFVALTEEAARAGLRKANVPEERIDRWTDFYRKVRDGLCAPVSMDVELVLGRKPLTFEKFVLDHAGYWRK